MKESIIRSIEGLYEQRTIELVKIAVRKKFTAVQILEWLRLGMERVGTHYEKGDYFIADLIFAGIIFQEVMDIGDFKALYAVPHKKKIGKLLVASVYGDCHDIGKNIFASFATAAGFQVFDIGVDTPVDALLNKTVEIRPDIIGLSGMQQDTLEEMKRAIQGLSDIGLRDQIKVLIGGACIEDGVTHSLIGADYSTKDVKKAVELCERWIQEK